MVKPTPRMSETPYSSLKVDELPATETPAAAYLGSHATSLLRHEGEEYLRKNATATVVVAFVIGLAVGRAVAG